MIIVRIKPKRTENNESIDVKISEVLKFKKFNFVNKDTSDKIIITKEVYKQSLEIEYLLNILF